MSIQAVLTASGGYCRFFGGGVQMVRVKSWCLVGCDLPPATMSCPYARQRGRASPTKRKGGWVGGGEYPVIIVIGCIMWGIISGGIPGDSGIPGYIICGMP